MTQGREVFAAGIALVCVGFLLLGAAIATFVTFSANSNTGDRKFIFLIVGVTKSEMEELKLSLNQKMDKKEKKDNITAAEGYVNDLILKKQNILTLLALAFQMHLNHKKKTYFIIVMATKTEMEELNLKLEGLRINGTSTTGWCFIVCAVHSTH